MNSHLPLSLNELKNPFDKGKTNLSMTKEAPGNSFDMVQSHKYTPLVMLHIFSDKYLLRKFWRMSWWKSSGTRMFLNAVWKRTSWSLAYVLFPKKTFETWQPQFWPAKHFFRKGKVSRISLGMLPIKKCPSLPLLLWNPNLSSEIFFWEWAKCTME